MDVIDREATIVSDLADLDRVRACGSAGDDGRDDESHAPPDRSRDAGSGRFCGGLQLLRLSHPPGGGPQ
jgi:hypothetical protein